MGKDVKIEGEKRDLHAEEVLEDLMMRVDDDDELMERQIYSMDEQETNFLNDDVVNNVVSSSIFYTDVDSFPLLPDFPCMSSSSSSSSLPPPLSTVSAISTVSTAPTATPSSSSSSSPASWAVLKSDSEVYHNRNYFQSGVVVNNINIPPIHQGPSLSSTSSMDFFSASQNGIPGASVMEDIGCLDLQIDDSDDIWDPSSIFLNESNTSQQEEEQKNMFAPEEHHQRKELENNNYDDSGNGFDFLQGNSELSGIFLDWLKQNKDFISAEDMRSITLKRSTIESAMRRLGNSNEGKKHLLKLILQWVEDCKLQKKKIDSENSLPNYHHHQPQFQDFVQNLNPDPNACISHSPWFMAANGPPGFAPDSGGGFVVSAPQETVLQPGMAYLGDPYACNSYIPQQAEFQQMHTTSTHHCWQKPPLLPAQLVMPPPPQYVPFPPDNNSGLSPPTPPQVAMYANSGSQYHLYQGFDGNGEGLVRMGSSATKEARKKRMARQRRLPTHHFRHHNPSTNVNMVHNQMQVNGHQHVIRMNNNDGLNCSSSAAVATTAANVGNWVYWPPSSTAIASSSTNVNMVHVGSPPQTIPNIDMTPLQRSVQTTNDRRQGLTTEKNLKFLLQKVLKQSDVGNLGRIVLPKKEAELHLPELESRDGIGIALEDIGTSRVWNMRYRFWPNNKSRMYLLENTGDFVRTNGLREGDFIVLYSDTKCGKYMIRGVKVRQQGVQPEGKKPIKRNIRKIAPAFNGTPHCAAITQAVK